MSTHFYGKGLISPKVSAAVYPIRTVAVWQSNGNNSLNVMETAIKKQNKGNSNERRLQTYRFYYHLWQPWLKSLHRGVTNNTFLPGPVEEQPYRCSAQPPASSWAAPLPQPPLRPESGEGSSSFHVQVSHSNHGVQSPRCSLTSSLSSITASFKR